jgi:hypothetical protein
MNTFLLWFHPVMQVAAVFAGLWAVRQGITRIRMTLLGAKIIFPWRQHVRIGSLALILWTLGALAFYGTHAVFGYAHITGLHAWLAWPVMFLSLFGLLSGHVMDRRKKKRALLPIAHGIANGILICLVFAECVTGVMLCFQFL